MRCITIIICFIALSLQAKELVYQDKEGIIRWTNNKERVAVFGANYCLPSACDYRAAAYVDGNRDDMIAEDLDHFKRMGWNGLRLCFWGDWQNTDREGNLIDNDHLRLFDKLIEEASKREIYMLLSPIVTYNSQWPEMNDTTNTGIMKYVGKADLILDPATKNAERNYINQLLNHRNRFTGRKIKDEPNILFVEIINEPSQFPDMPDEMTDYINGMVDEIKSAGCEKLLFYNVSQNWKVAPIVAASKVDGGTYAWYPGGLTSFRAIPGNPLLCVDRYEQLMDPAMKGKSKIVYEFDATQSLGGLQTAAMIREFVRGGCQFIAMFSYDMLRTAPKNLGWDVQYTNMVYTPRKAVASMIGAEMMKRWKPGQPNEYYPKNNKFGDFRISYDEDLVLLNSTDSYYHSGNVTDKPKNISELKHIAGVGSSPMIEYSGNGIYFLDRSADGFSWTLDLFPDILALDDPFHPSAYKDVSIADARKHVMTVNLPGIEVSDTVYAGKYTVDANGFKRIADHPQQDLYSSYKGWPTHGADSRYPDRWKYNDWYTQIQPMEETSNLITVLNACDGLKMIDYTRNFESPECRVRLIRTLDGMNNAYELKTPDLTENPEWRTAADVTFQTYCGDKLWNRKGSVPKYIKIWAKGLNGTDKALVNFMDKNGRAFGSAFNLTNSMQEITIDVSSVSTFPAVVLPQDWPGVCSYYYPQSKNVSGKPDWDNIELVQVSLRGNLYPDGQKHDKGIIVEKFILEY